MGNVRMEASKGVITCKGETCPHYRECKEEYERKLKGGGSYEQVREAE